MTRGIDMSGYIDRDFLERRIHETMDMQDLYLPIHFIQLMDEQDTVDAVEVKHGHWEEQIVDDSTIIEIWQSARCSKCGRYHTTPYVYYFDEFNYCPQCGAKMDEVTE